MPASFIRLTLYDGRPVIIRVDTINSIFAPLQDAVDKGVGAGIDASYPAGGGQVPVKYDVRETVDQVQHILFAVKAIVGRRLTLGRTTTWVNGFHEADCI